MSRAYRISVSESINRVIHAEDHVSTQLELLEILPCEEMGQILGAELAKQGFQLEGNTASLEKEGVKTEVDLVTGTVTVRSDSQRSVTVQQELTGYAYDDVGPGEAAAKKELQKRLQGELEKQVEQKKESLQNEATEKLEQQLNDIKTDLDQAVNRATAAALKRKAAQLGQIKEMTEDAQTGSLTIVVEV
jgi:hypothetical protein